MVTVVVETAVVALVEGGTTLVDVVDEDGGALTDVVGESLGAPPEVAPGESLSREAIAEKVGATTATACDSRRRTAQIVAATTSAKVRRSRPAFSCRRPTSWAA